MKLTKKKPNLFLAFTIALAFVCLAILPEVGSARDDNKAISIGSKLEDFSLIDVNGKQQSFNSLKGKNGTVVIFLSAQCPVVNKNYKDRILQISKDYQAKGVNFVGINSNATETLEYVKTNAEERGYAFPVLIDKGNVIADKLGATVTPETYLFDANGKLVYRGAIDNDRNGENITAKYLGEAIDATLAGKAVAKTEANAFGCSIKRASK
jgi:peroxiredoxin